MDKIYDLIKGPIVTEKSGRLHQDENQYSFKVDHRVTKTEIKQAVEALFKVKVIKVNTLNVTPKKKRVGRYSGMTNKYKKAFITLAAGNKIDI